MRKSAMAVVQRSGAEGVNEAVVVVVVEQKSSRSRNVSLVFVLG